jgi:hypothetical protein
VGKLVRDGRVEYFLAKGELLLPVKSGDALDAAYRVEAVDADSIALRYLPLDTVTELAISAPINNPPAAARVSAPAPMSLAPVPPFLAQALQPASEAVAVPQSIPVVHAAQLRGPRTPPTTAAR